VAPPGPRLAVDLSGGLIRVLEGAPGGPIRCGSGGSPAGSFVDGRITDPAAVGGALRQLLARAEIHETRALVAINDSLASFRTLSFPASATDQAIDSAVAKQFPMDPERMATRWAEIRETSVKKDVFAVAWDRALVNRITDAAKAAGLDPVVVDLKSACVARAVAYPSCVVVDMGADPVDIFLIAGHVPQVWHSLKLDQSRTDMTSSLVTALSSVLRFYERRRDTDFGPASPILIAGEQVVSAQLLSALSSALGHPAEPLPAPRRVPADIRHGTYLTCLGLIMRRIQ
jgi:hypothetical protein